MRNIPIAVQLYTLREKMKSDFLGVLDQVAEIGYQGVEFAGFGGFSADELKKHLDKIGLEVVGSHTGLNLLREDLNNVIEYNKELGNKYIVVPYVDFDTKEDYIDLAKELTEIGAILKENDLQLCYHNHAHELNKYNGKYGLDLLYNNVDSDLLQAEIDTYWVKKAGLDPIDYIDKYSGRIPLLHLKDLEADTGDFAEVGEGIIDIKGLTNQAKAIDTEWLIVEQDQCKKPALESVKISFNNLTQIIESNN